ncbi:hypothetical protein KVK26_04905 [Helicobacter pylori]|nr:hypothetical protein KVK26_04905 [Helicobacter pylori]
MGFQNENKLKVGASVKATINDKVVEAKVIGVGFNRVTLQSEKGQTATYAFNSDKFLKWFNKVPLTEALKTNAENKQDDADDLLKGIKIVTSGPSVKQRTTTPKEKESKFKLAFGFKDSGGTNFETLTKIYALAERKERLGVLMCPMFYGGGGNQAVAVILHALGYASKLRHHKDTEWYHMIKNRNLEECWFDSFGQFDVTDTKLFCDLIGYYATSDEEKNEERKKEVTDLSPSGLWAKALPANENEAMFVAQLLCDGGINTYNLSCAGLTENLLKDIIPMLGLVDNGEDLEDNAEGENLEN